MCESEKSFSLGPLTQKLSPWGEKMISCYPHQLSTAYSHKDTIEQN